MELTDYPQEYLISNEKYRGPIKLLLELVQSKKIDIYQISLNDIISGFIKFINENKPATMDIISGFVWTASVLLEIKSRSLLPSKKKQDHKMEPGEELLREREREYRIFKKISSYLEKTMETEQLFFLREAPLEKEFMEIMPDFLEGININDLLGLATMLLKGEPVQLNLDIVYSHSNIKTIYDEMDRVKQRLYSKPELTFRDLTMEYEQIIEIIICFLSILELYKNEEIEIIQFENFGSILIKKIGKDG